jgi:hypothetical protein
MKIKSLTAAVIGAVADALNVRLGGGLKLSRGDAFSSSCVQETFKVTLKASYFYNFCTLTPDPIYLVCRGVA